VTVDVSIASSAIVAPVRDEPAPNPNTRSGGLITADDISYETTRFTINTQLQSKEHINMIITEK